MDRYLFDKFILEFDEDTLDNLYKFILTKAQEKIEIGKKGYYNYYPQEDRGIQLIIETTQEDHRLELENMFFHHTSPSVWNLRIIHQMKDFPNTYLVSREDGKGGCIIRLVNEDVLGKKLKADDIIEVQVSAFALGGGIFETEEDFEQSIQNSEDSNGNMLADGTLMPLNLIINNNAYLTDEERDKNDHFKDNLLSFKGTVELTNAYDLNMFDIDLPSYYHVIIDTEYGKLPIFFTSDFLNPEMKRIGKGNIIHGEIFLSGDVCINEYDKYIRGNDLRIEQD